MPRGVYKRKPKDDAAPETAADAPAPEHAADEPAKPTAARETFYVTLAWYQGEWRYCSTGKDKPTGMHRRSYAGQMVQSITVACEAESPEDAKEAVMAKSKAIFA